MPEISVIVPVYKVEKYLNRCIDSILKQTFSDFELILIVDGSPDNCGNICDQYAGCDRRIHVVHKINGGVGSARNTGIKMAVGNYLAFIDSDDYIEPNMFEKLHTISKIYDADITICGVNYCSDSGEILRSGLQLDAIYHNSELFETLFEAPNPVGGGTCNKMFRCTGKQLLFPEDITIGEDIIYLYDRFAISNKAIKISEPLYNIVERGDSATRENMASTLCRSLESYKVLVEKAWVAELPVHIKRKAVNKLLDNALLNVKLIKRDSSISIINKNKYVFRTIKLMIPGLFRAKKERIISSSRFYGYVFELVKRYIHHY